MPVFNLPFAPKIRISFNGVVITRIQDGAPSAEIGALRDSDCHQPKIQIREITANNRLKSRQDILKNNIPGYLNDDLSFADNFSLTKNFTLWVENPTDSGLVQVFHKNTHSFNRLDEENDARDFRWFIDLEEFFGKTIGLDTDKLAPRFIMNNGIFYTKTISPGEVKINRPGDTPQRFGRYGLEIGANIYFNPNSSAVLKYGDTELLPLAATDSSRFEIDFSCDCHVDLDESDFPLLFGAINQGLTDDDRAITLEGDPLRTGPEHTPETYCGGGNCRSC